jgi:hypothetical protein
MERMKKTTAPPRWVMELKGSWNPGMGRMGGRSDAQNLGSIGSRISIILAVY